MTIPQNEPGTDVVDTDKAGKPAPNPDDSNEDLPLTEADEENERSPTNPS